MSPSSRWFMVLLWSLCACAGERGSGSFSIGDNADRIAVGTSTAIRIHNDNRDSHGLFKEHSVLKEDAIPITNLQIETVPEGVVSTRLDGDLVIVTGLRPGKVTVSIRGEVRGVPHEQSVAIEAVLPAYTYYEIAGHVVRPGEEITLLRGVRYLASVRVYDALGARLNATLRPTDAMDRSGVDPSWTSTGDIPVAGPGWIWDSFHAVGTVHDARAETIYLPAIANTRAPRARFIDDVTLDLDWSADHHRVSLIATSRDGTFRQRVPIAVTARQPDGCTVGFDLTGVWTRGGPCNAALTIETDPENLYPSTWTGPLPVETSDKAGSNLDYSPTGTIVRPAR